MKKIIMDYCLLHQMNIFGPIFFWFSCIGKKVPFWQFLTILKNCQNGTFLPMHENQKFFGPNAFIWTAKKVPFRDFIQNMSQAPSKCLSKWIKVDKWDYLKGIKNYFCLGFLWLEGKTREGPFFKGSIW